MARSRGRRSDYQWTQFGDVENAHDISSAVGTLGSTVSVVTIPQTLMRTRGRIGAYLDAGGVDESVMLLCGVTVLSADAVAAPELFQSSQVDDANWIWQGQIFLHSGVGVVAGSEEGQFGSIEVDSKAMRRLKPSSQVVFVFQTPAELVTDQGGTLDISWYLHCLIAT